MHLYESSLFCLNFCTRVERVAEGIKWEKAQGLYIVLWSGAKNSVAFNGCTRLCKKGAAFAKRAETAAATSLLSLTSKATKSAVAFSFCETLSVLSWMVERTQQNQNNMSQMQVRVNFEHFTKDEKGQNGSKMNRNGSMFKFEIFCVLMYLKWN